MPFFMCTLSFLCISSYAYYKIIENLQLSSQNIHILIKIKKIDCDTKKLKKNFL